LANDAALFRGWSARSQVPSRGGFSGWSGATTKKPRRCRGFKVDLRLPDGFGCCGPPNRWHKADANRPVIDLQIRAAGAGWKMELGRDHIWCGRVMVW